VNHIAASDYQNALVTQQRQFPAYLEVELSRSCFIDAELNDGNFRMGDRRAATRTMSRDPGPTTYPALPGTGAAAFAHAKRVPGRLAPILHSI